MNPVTVDAELTLPGASTLLARLEYLEPSDHVMQSDSHYVDLSLTPRPKNTRAHYEGGWEPERYQPVGSVLLVPAGHSFRFRTDPGRMAFVMCQIAPDALSRWAGEELTWSGRLIETALDVPNPNLRRPLVRLAEELRCPGFASAAMAEMLLGQITIELARHCRSYRDTPHGGGLAGWQLRLIDDRLAELRAPPSLEELARLTNLSIRQLTRGFRLSRGAAIGDYIAQKRVAFACDLLGAGISIKVAAHRLGFSSHSSFTSAFRRATGVTPRQFRLQVLRARA